MFATQEVCRGKQHPREQTALGFPVTGMEAPVVMLTEEETERNQLLLGQSASLVQLLLPNGH